MIVITKKKTIWNGIIKLRLYYLNENINSKVYSSYFLLGFRKKKIILRTSSLLSTLEKIILFLGKLKESGGSLWVYGRGGSCLKLVRWVALSTKANFFIEMSRSGFLFFVSGKYFWISHRYFSNQFFNFIGVSCLLLPCVLGNRRLIWLSQNYGVPTVGAAHLGNCQILTYPMLISLLKPSRVLFFLRTIVYRLK